MKPLSLSYDFFEPIIKSMGIQINKWVFQRSEEWYTVLDKIRFVRGRDYME